MKKNPASKIAAVLGIILVIAIAYGCVTTISNRKKTAEEYEADSTYYSGETDEFDENDETADFSEEETEEEEEEETTKKKKEKDEKKTSEEEETSSKTANEKKTYSNHKENGKTYIDGILIVNKTYALPEDYNPGIDPEAQSALDEMEAAASEEGISLWIQSGFRSYSYQKELYENYAAQDGYDEADRYSARPGHSEHQTGLAFDLNSLSTSFGETTEGRWLAANCWKYGFIIRYPQGKESVTGYMYEPWHVRFIGKDMAKSVYDSGLCLEEYLGITSQYAD